MTNKKKLFISLAVPLAVGGAAALLTMGSMSSYDSIIKPQLSPPPVVFPIAWTVLYILMGISCYLIWNSDKANKEDVNKALWIYGIQLALNAAWPLLFFNGKLFSLSLVELIIMLVTVILMTVKFGEINKTASYLQIPYILWLIFAAYLNYSVYILNRT